MRVEKVTRTPMTYIRKDDPITVPSMFSQQEQVERVEAAVVDQDKFREGCFTIKSIKYDMDRMGMKYLKMKHESSKGIIDMTSL